MCVDIDTVNWRCRSMKQYIGCDAHKKYSIFSSIDEAGRRGCPVRVEHDRRIYAGFLRTLPEGSVIAVESIGSWYWMIDEMEKAGHEPALVDPRKAKLMMGQVNKTDKLDADGLAVLNRNGTLPRIWIPSSGIRDQRELPRMRTAMVGMRTKLKNRIHAALAKYNIQIDAVSDIFGVEGRRLLAEALVQLPSETRHATEEQIELLDETQKHIEAAEDRIKELIKTTPEMMLLDTLPGVGPILAIICALEIGSVDRFRSASALASYAGTVPRERSSGGKVRFGTIRPDVNRYLRWALIEAVNCIILQAARHPEWHTVRLYQRIKQHKGHGKAVVAVARHLAEAAFWVLKKRVPYREPLRNELVSSNRN